LQKDLEDQCVSLEMKAQKMVHYVVTRWNTFHDTLDRSITLEQPLMKLVILPKHNERNGRNLKHFKLTDTEWKILKQLLPMLKWFKQITEKVSKSGVPLLHKVIPWMDTFEGLLKGVVKDSSKHGTVRAAAARGLAVLNKYYSKTDDNVMYRICMREFF
ncbi:hypothetical protein K435DRAFT_672838, partial [Dendrothele bispora CBS 962.96]